MREPLTSACLTCPLYNDREYSPVIGKGSQNPDVIIIGETPGRDEIRAGKPFVGQAGKKLKELLEQSGITELELRFENAVLCRPQKENGDNRTPTKEEIYACRPHLEAVIQHYKPKALAILGNIPLLSIEKRRKLGGITNARNIGYCEEFSCIQMPTLHPSYVLREPGQTSSVIDDFRQLLNKLTGKEEEKLPTYYGTADTWEKVELTLQALKDHKKFTFDIETAPYNIEDLQSDGLNYLKDNILCIAFSWEPCVGVVIPIFEYPDKDFWGERQGELINRIKNVLEDSTLGKIAHNAMFDCNFLRGRYGIEVNNLVADTLLQHHLLDENSAHGLKPIASRLTDMGDYDRELDKLRANNHLKKNRHYGNIPPEVLYPYASADVDATYRLYSIFTQKIEDDPGLSWVHKNVTVPLAPLLSNMGFRGIRVDENEVNRLDKEFDETLNDIALGVQQRANYPLNLSSPDQLRAYLFNDNPKELPLNSLSLTTNNKTDKGSLSTNKATLLELEEKNPDEISPIIKYRKLSKLSSTYLKGTLKLLDINHFLHPNYKQFGTKTHRLSCTKPNLQNIPKAKGGVKTIFIPRDGYVFVEGDYSNAELRGLAHESQEPSLLRAFANDEDVHIATASKIFGLSYEELFEEYTTTNECAHRYAAKTINFGIVYGEGARKLAGQLGWTFEKASSFIKQYLKKLSNVSRWINEQKEFVREYGYVVNWLGLRRNLPTINSYDKELVSLAERQAVNSVLQSLAAQFTYLGMIRINERLKREGLDAFILLNVHDSILTEAKEDIAYYVKELMQEEMERDVTNYLGETFTVKMKADLGICNRWGEEKDKAKIKEAEEDSEIIYVLEDEEEDEEE